MTTDLSNFSTSIGICFYNCGSFNKSDHSSIQYTTLPNSTQDLDEFMCGHFNRTGTLCGRCKDNHYPLAHSFDMNCVECPNGQSNWWKYVLVVYLPLTIFYFIVLFFRINVTSSNLHGFVFYSQGIVMPLLARLLLLNALNSFLETIMRYIGSLYTIWNLDFLRIIKLDICLHLDTLQTLALDVAVGMYSIKVLSETWFTTT